MVEVEEEEEEEDMFSSLDSSADASIHTIFIDKGRVGAGIRHSQGFSL